MTDSARIAALLANAVHDTWVHLAVPHEPFALPMCLEAQSIADLFRGVRFDEVDIRASQLYGEEALLYMCKEGLGYYLGTYLYVCLNVIAQEGEGLWDGPENSLICLLRNLADGLSGILNSDQMECVVGYLQFKVMYPERYELFFDENREALATWQRSLAAAYRSR